MSKEVKRYDPFGYDGLSALMREDVLGDYVSWDDFDALRAELAEANADFVRIANEREALLAERDAMRRDAERWRPLSAPGQIKAGDWLSFTVGGKFKCARVKEVLRPGSDREEVIWNRRKNFYFVTRMALDGSSTHKRVMIAALQGEQP